MIFSTLAFFLPVLVQVAAAKPASELLVSTKYGPVRGHYAAGGDNTVREFLGIPYGAPATGKLRWAAAAPPTRWTVPLNAKDFGPTCYNIDYASPTSSDENSPVVLPPPPSEGEDCLSINVWTPSEDRLNQGGASVLLWIYGGGFRVGGSFTDFYSGANLVRDQKNVILVSFNYRLNIFGFPATPDLKTKQQNLGLRDVRSAVEWTRDNIHRFGGDPKKITLFGESAGGAAADAYLYSSKDDPIIRGVILQSGVTTREESAPPTGDAWKALTVLLKCDDAKNVLECMRAVPAKRLKTTVANNNLTFTPIPDGDTMFPNSLERLRSGKFARIPMLVGNNNAEIPSSPESTQSSFTCPSARTARHHVRYAPTWQYRYFGDFTGAGAFHGSEIRQVFGTYNVTTATKGQRDTSKYMQGAWAAFAKDPEKGLEKYGAWPQYDPSHRSLVKLAVNNSPGAQFASPEDFEDGCTF